MQDRVERTLLIVGSNVIECRNAALDFGLNPLLLRNFRYATKAIQLRGITPGTPCIYCNREFWPATQEGLALDSMLRRLELSCTVRPLREDEISNYQDGVAA